MAQVEKRGGLLRKSSASKKPLKEKVVLMYDEIFMTEDPSKCSPRFWEELFLMKVNLEYLEGKLESLDGEELMKIKDNINCLFQHCIQALGEEHPIRVVNALQTLCALIRGVHQKNKSTSGFDIINMLMGFDKAELCMKVTDNISQNTILEYVMINSIFEAILQILSHPPSRREHGYDAVVLLALLVNYRKYEGMGLVIAQALSEYNRQYKDKEEEHQSGFFSALTNMVGSMFIADAHEKISVQTNEAILLALYEAVHLNRNFITVLAQSHPEMGLVTTPVSPAPTTPATPLGTTPPSSDVISSVELPLDADVQTSNLLITFLKYSSIVMQDTKDLMVEFIVTHMMKEFPMDLYVRCIQVVHKLLCYQKKCRVRLHYTWRELWSVLRLSTNAGQWKEAASKVTHALVNIRAIINHFNPKIESYAAVNHISQLSEEQVLEVVRANYDTLTLKLQDGLDQYERYSEQHKEAAFFKELVRSISTNVRRNLAFHTLSQEVLLKEFSTIS
ncbi:hypothetical protein TREES_T100016486 [Tupaia chinensis]|uniref:Armadillo-like helical domain-containing protein n=1 Tax=Tupaia chinensis TaxID=246437 RepID=L8Y5V6_TUPCH|nr:hypothetical protein TREES_T100016486 [Tupaia chinensis]